MKLSSVSIIGLALWAAHAGAEVRLDQEQAVIDWDRWRVVGGAGEQKLAQVFRAGLTGTLTHMELPLECDPASPDVLWYELRDVTDGGAPTDPSFGSIGTSVSWFAGLVPDADGFRRIILARLPIIYRVTAGRRYAFELRMQGASACKLYMGPVDSGDLYPEGGAYYDKRPNPPGWVPISTNDWAFRTYVDVGPPAAPPRLCEFETAYGMPNDWVPRSAPICACLRDPVLASERCWFELPEAILFRELPWPVPRPSGQVGWRWISLLQSVHGAKITTRGIGANFTTQPITVPKSLAPDVLHKATMPYAAGAITGTRVEIELRGSRGVGTWVFRTYEREQ